MTRKNEFSDVFKQIDIRGEDECWPWLGSISRDGTPYITVEGRKYVAYRVVAWLTRGGFNLLDERVATLHSCQNSAGKPIDDRTCCNPKHTREGTHEENIIDMMMRGRSGLTEAAIRDILNISDEFKELTHGQIAKRIEFKHQVKCARQTVTDILSGRRRAMLQARIRSEDAAIEGGSDESE